MRLVVRAAADAHDARLGWCLVVISAADAQDARLGQWLMLMMLDSFVRVVIMLDFGGALSANTGGCR